MLQEGLENIATGCGLVASSQIGDGGQLEEAATVSLGDGFEYTFSLLGVSCVVIRVMLNQQRCSPPREIWPSC